MRTQGNLVTARVLQFTQMPEQQSEDDFSTAEDYRDALTFKSLEVLDVIEGIGTINYLVSAVGQFSGEFRFLVDYRDVLKVQLREPSFAEAVLTLAF